MAARISGGGSNGDETGICSLTYLGDFLIWTGTVSQVRTGQDKGERVPAKTVCFTASNHSLHRSGIV